MAFRRGASLFRQGLAKRALTSAQPEEFSFLNGNLILEAPPPATRSAPAFSVETFHSANTIAKIAPNWNSRGSQQQYFGRPWWGQARYLSSSGGESGDRPPAGEEGGLQPIEGIQPEGDEGQAAEEADEAANHEGAADEEGSMAMKDYWPYPVPDDLEVDEDEMASYLIGEDVRGIAGLPPYEDIIGADPDEEEKEKRREKERKQQEEIAASRVQKIDDLGRAYATGRRKTSTARVWLSEGEGTISVNGKPYDKVFPNILQRVEILTPLQLVDRIGVFDVRSTVKGGGIQGQAQAIRHGISRALQLFDPELRPNLKSAGLLTRDPRMVERKKPGKKKARKSFQWVKR